MIKEVIEVIDSKNTSSSKQEVEECIKEHIERINVILPTPVLSE